MTREEAINRIKDHMVAHHIGEYPHIRLKEAFELAIDALRHQIWEEQLWHDAKADPPKTPGLYYTELEKRRYFVTEYCPHCDTESTLMWSVEEHGYQIYCPVCGKKIMLCSDCGHHNDCDWTEESGCKMKKEEYHE